MIEHSTYGGQLEFSDLPAGIEEQVAEELPAGSVAFESGPASGAELVVESTLSRLEKRTAREVIRDAVEIDRRVVLNLRISFPEVRYEVCVQG